MKSYKNYILLIFALCMQIQFIPAQNNAGKKTVKGVILDAETKEILPGVNIVVKGVASAISDEKGEYKLKVPQQNHIILEVSALGYAKRDISVQNDSIVNVLLYDESFNGATNQVYTLLGELNSTKLANSYGVINKVNDLSVQVTPDQLIQGSVSGVNSIFRSGMPGNGSNIYIHGFNTMNAGTQPLFVIDGLPYENSSTGSSLIDNYCANPLASIEVKDIESISVLKDGTSLYGVKGANGVILIKTYKTQKPETRINAHLHTGITFEPDAIPVLNATNYRNLLSDVLQSQNANPDYISTLPYFDKTLPVKEKWGYEGNTDYYRYNHDTDWQKQIYQAKLNQNAYLNVSGGDEVALYMLSIGFLNQQGLLNNTNFNRFNTRFNSSVRLTKDIDFLSNMSFVYGTKNLANEGSDTKRNPILAALVKSPFMTSNVYNEEGIVSPNLEPVDVFGNSNPYAVSNNISMTNINYRFMGSFQLIWNIDKHFTIANLIGLNFNKEREKIYYPSTGIAFDPVNDNIITNESQHRVERLFSLYNDAYLNYKYQNSTRSNLNIRGGLRYQSNDAENDYGVGYNSSSDNFRSIQYGTALLRQVGGTLGKWNWLSMYATADYSIDDKYFVNVNMSSDATSRSGVDASRLFTYPSVTGAWLISGEKFMQNNKVINLLKLRASYGLSGNDDIGNYNAIRYYKPQNLLGTYGLIRGNLVDTSLKPETVVRRNAGLDISLLDERVNVSLDVYSNLTKDMILNTIPERITGFSSFYTNAGSMQNTGVDLNLNTRIINRKFKWDVTLLLSTSKNTVLDLNGATYETDIFGATIQTKEDQPLGMFYGYQTKGVYATTEDANADGLSVMKGLVKVPFGAGDVRFVNQNDDDIIDENDRVVIGNPNPDFFGSFSNSFKYNQWTLNTKMTFSVGNDVYNYTRSQLESMSDYNNQTIAVLNRWRYEGNVTNIPKATYGDPMGNARFSDRWIEDGSYLRLKEVQLSYNLIFKDKFIQNCSVFVTAENLFTLTKYKGLDPEFAYGQNPLYAGVDACGTPQPRILSVGVKLGL